MKTLDNTEIERIKNLYETFKTDLKCHISNKTITSKQECYLVKKPWDTDFSNNINNYKVNNEPISNVQKYRRKYRRYKENTANESNSFNFPNDSPIIINDNKTLIDCLKQNEDLILENCELIDSVLKVYNLRNRNIKINYWAGNNKILLEYQNKSKYGYEILLIENASSIHERILKSSKNIYSIKLQPKLRFINEQKVNELYDYLLSREKIEKLNLDLYKENNSEIRILETKNIFDEQNADPLPREINETKRFQSGFIRGNWRKKEEKKEEKTEELIKEKELEIPKNDEDSTKKFQVIRRKRYHATQDNPNEEKNKYEEVKTEQKDYDNNKDNIKSISNSNISRPFYRNRFLPNQKDNNNNTINKYEESTNNSINEKTRNQNNANEINKLKEELEKLKKENENLKQKNYDLNKLNSDYIKDNNNLRLDLKNSNQQKNNLEREKNDLNQKLKDKEKEMSKINNSNNKENQNLKNELKNVNSDLKKYKEQEKNYLSKLNEYERKEKNNLQNERNFQEKINILEKEKKDLLQKKNFLEKEKEEIENNLQKEKEEGDELFEENQNLKRENEENKKEIKNLENQLKKKDKDFNNELSKLKKENQDEISKIKSQLDEEIKYIETIDEENKKLKENEKNFQKEIKVHENNEKNYSSKIKEYETIIKQKEKEFNTINRTIKDLENSVKNNEKEYRKNLNKLENEKKSTEIELDNKTNENEKLIKENKKLSENEKNYLKRIKDYEIEEKNYQSNIKELQNEIKNKEKDLNDLKQSYDELASENDKLYEDNDSFKKKEKEYQNEINQLKENRDNNDKLAEKKRKEINQQILYLENKEHEIEKGLEDIEKEKQNLNKIREQLEQDRKNIINSNSKQINNNLNNNNNNTNNMNNINNMNFNNCNPNYGFNNNINNNNMNFVNTPNTFIQPFNNMMFNNMGNMNNNMNFNNNQNMININSNNNQTINNSPKPKIQGPLATYKKPTLIGLNNIGATCYLNSTLQCLSQTTILTNYFLNEKNKEKIINNNIAKKNPNDLQLCPAYLELIKNLWNKNAMNKSYSPNNFMNTIEAMNSLFIKGQAGDSKDFIIFILEQIHNELKKPNKNNKTPKEELNQYDKNNALNNFFYEFQNELSIISDTFFGFNETTNTCLYCKNYYMQRNMNYPICYNYGIFNVLIFPLEEVKNMRNSMNRMNNAMIKNTNVVNLYECFYYNQKTDLFTGENKNYCNICKKLEDSEYTSRIFSAPNILILILNRGKNNIYKVAIDFNEALDISQFVLQKSENLTYNLYGVITHLGESGPNAHFVSTCKSPIDNKWYRYNDAMVNPISNFQKDVVNFGNPYILFYQRN